MSKRKRTKPEGTPAETPSEGAEGDPGVHVTPDMLAGSPDIFAPSKDRPVEGSDEHASSTAASDETPEAEPAPADESGPASEEASTAGAETPATPEEAIATTPLTPPYQPRPPA